MATESLVSTIIPVYNRPRLVLEAISSVLAQSYRPIEILVVDDGSIDETLSILRDFSSTHSEIRILTQRNSGPGVARQRGLDAAKGQFIQFLDSDDVISSTKFEIQIAALKSDPRADISYGKTIYTPKNGVQQKPWLRTGMQFEMMFPAMLSSRIWGTSTPLYRANLFEKAGPFSHLSNEEDWEMDCRIAALGTRLAWVDSWVSEERDIADVRASHAGSSDPRKLGDRLTARCLILRAAVSSGVDRNCLDSKLFVKSSFLVARQAATAGLGREARSLIVDLNEYDRDPLKTSFLALGSLLGLKRATLIAEWAHGLLRKGPGGAVR